MNRDDLFGYWIPACENLFEQNYKDLSNFGGDDAPLKLFLGQLDHALGINEFETYIHTAFSDDKPLPEELKKLLIMLAGPHGKTILKIMKIRKGPEDGS